MSEIKLTESAPTEDNGEEKDWAAAKAFFDNLKTNKPRPVSTFALQFYDHTFVCKVQTLSCIQNVT